MKVSIKNGRRRYIGELTTDEKDFFIIIPNTCPKFRPIRVKKYANFKLTYLRNDYENNIK